MAYGGVEIRLSAEKAQMLSEALRKLGRAKRLAGIPNGEDQKSMEGLADMIESVSRGKWEQAGDEEIEVVSA